MSVVLSVDGMTKSYGRVTVLRDVSLQVRSGEIHALLGANGAGKSTLSKMISGLTTVTAGTMRLSEKPYVPQGKHQAEASGVQMIQQELNLIPTLNVAENLSLARLPNRWGMIRHRELHRLADEALGRLEINDIDTHLPVAELGVGRRQMIEIASALARECRLLILDEPTAALSGTETELLFSRLRELRKRGVGMIYISHRLEEVKQIADRVTILRDGMHVCTEGIESLSTDRMVELMSGTEKVPPDSPPLAKEVSRLDRSIETPPALEVSGLSNGIVDDVSFSAAPGEVLGITGLIGSGRTELLRAIFGADRASSGSVSVCGGPKRLFSSPSQAVRHGLAMVTEDRKNDGLLLDQSIRFNTSINSLGARFSRFGFLRRSQEAKQSQQQCVEMETRCTSIEQRVRTLSGGNQQKVAIAKWLTRGASVYLFDEPTRGIDVAARKRIYRLFAELTGQRKAIVVVSSDLDELFETCDRIAVMSAGRLVETFSKGQWSEDAILEASFQFERTGRVR